MGCLTYQIPLTSSCLNVANLALCGIPFLAGFYSKDLILEIVSLSYINLFRFFLFFFSTGLTVCYSFRLVYYSLTGDFNRNALHPLNDEGWVILKSMLGLLLMAVIGGSILRWLIFPTPDIICLPYYLKFLTLFVCITGGIVGYLISNVALYFSNKSLHIYRAVFFSGSMWFIPSLSTVGAIYYPLYTGMVVLKSFDQGWREYFGGQHLYKTLAVLSKFNQVLQNNNLKIYLLSFILWVIILVSLMVL